MTTAFGQETGAVPGDANRDLLIVQARGYAGQVGGPVQFTLRTLERDPFDQIAPKIGRSVGAVRMLWARALEKLNRSLESRR